MIILALIAARLTRVTGQSGAGAKGARSSVSATPAVPSQSYSSSASATSPKVLNSRGVSGMPKGSSSEPPLEKDPRRPGYDAARVFGLRMDSAKLLFEAEPRDEAWARQRESDIEASALTEFKNLDPNVQMEIECRAGTCRVRVHSRNSYLTDVMAHFPLTCLVQFAQPDFGDSTSENPDAKDPFSDFYLMFGAATRSSDGFAAQRASTCPRYRDGWLRGASAQ